MAVEDLLYDWSMSDRFHLPLLSGRLGRRCRWRSLSLRPLGHCYVLSVWLSLSPERLNLSRLLLRPCFYSPLFYTERKNHYKNTRNYQKLDPSHYIRKYIDKTINLEPFDQNNISLSEQKIFPETYVEILYHILTDKYHDT